MIVAYSTEGTISATLGDPHGSIRYQGSGGPVTIGGQSVTIGGQGLEIGEALAAHGQIHTDEVLLAAIADGSARVGYRVLADGVEIAASSGGASGSAHGLEELVVTETIEGTVATLVLPVGADLTHASGTVSRPRAPIAAAAVINIEVTHRAPGASAHATPLLTGGRVSGARYLDGPGGRRLVVEAMDSSVEWGSELVDLVVPGGSQEWRGVLIAGLLTGIDSDPLPGISRIRSRVQIAATERRQAIDLLLSGTGKAVRVGRDGVVELIGPDYDPAIPKAGDLELTVGEVDEDWSSLYRALDSARVTGVLPVATDSAGAGAGAQCTEVESTQQEEVAGTEPAPVAAWKQEAGLSTLDVDGNPDYGNSAGDLTAVSLSSSIPTIEARTVITTVTRCGQMVREVQDEYGLLWPAMWRYTLGKAKAAGGGDTGGVVIIGFSSAWVPEAGALKVDGNLAVSRPIPRFDLIQRTTTTRTFDSRGHLSRERSVTKGWYSPRRYLKKRVGSDATPWEEIVLDGTAHRDAGNGDQVATLTDEWMTLQVVDSRIESDDRRYIRRRLDDVQRVYARDGSLFLYGDGSERLDETEALRRVELRETSYLPAGEGGHRELVRVRDARGRVQPGSTSPVLDGYLPEVPVLEAEADGLSEPELSEDTQEVSRSYGTGQAAEYRVAIAGDPSEIEAEARRRWQADHAETVRVTVPLDVRPTVGSRWSVLRLGQGLPIHVQQIEHRIAPDGVVTRVQGLLYQG